jgi:hypothetical protein
MATAAKKKFPVPIGALIALPIALLVGYWCFNSYRKWAAQRATEAKLDAEMAALNKSNTVMGNLYDAVTLKKYQVCNKSADQITLNWVVAVYHDNKSMRVFDSDRCQEWKPLVLASGDNKNVLLRTGQPGCNWDGSVIYYAMRYTQENEEEDKFRIFTVVGPYQGFERDCYNFQ